MPSFHHLHLIFTPLAHRLAQIFLTVAETDRVFHNFQSVGKVSLIYISNNLKIFVHYFCPTFFKKINFS